MSAAQWRRAMNSSAAAAAVAARGSSAVSLPSPVPIVPAHAAPAPSDPWSWLNALFRHVRWRHVIVLAFVLLYQFFA